MADNVIEVANEQQTEQANELAQMMAISLNGGIAPQVASETQEVVEEQQQIVPATFEILKEKFGYESPEAAVAEIESLRVLKSQPPATEAPKFENEFNEKLYKAIQAGQVKEVTQLLAQQERLDSLTTSEVNESNAADIIKLGMQLEYKTLTQAEIDYKFNKQYALPKEPVQSDSELDEDFAQRKAEWQEKVTDIQMSRMIDAKMAIPKLVTAKSEIKLPEIPTTVDEDYVQYRKMLDEQAKIDEEVQAAYKSFTPKSIETKINFIDEANKIGFEFQYEPSSEAFNKSLGMALDINTFFDAFKKSDGTPDRQKFLDAIHFALNKESILTEAMKQAKNATIKSFLPDNSNNNGQRISPAMTGELSELQKQMQAAGIKY
jgi:hypothetical protein